MATKTQSLAHTKWLCKYHIVFTPKYRRKVIYNQYRNSLREILRRLCEYKGVKIIEGELMADHVHMLVLIPSNTHPLKGECYESMAMRLERSESQRL